MARHHEGWTQEAIAEELDVDPRTVGRIIEAVGQKRSAAKKPKRELRLTVSVARSHRRVIESDPGVLPSSSGGFTDVPKMIWPAGTLT